MPFNKKGRGIFTVMARTETGGLKDPPGEGIQPTYIKSAVIFSLLPLPPSIGYPKRK